MEEREEGWNERGEIGRRRERKGKERDREKEREREREREEWRKEEWE